MSAVVILKFLHIAMMFTAVGVATGTEVMATHQVIQTLSVPNAHGIGAVAIP